MAAFFSLFETALGICGIAWREAEPDSAGFFVTHLLLPDASPDRTAACLALECGGQPAETPEPIAAVQAAIRRHLAGELQDFREVPVDCGAARAFARQVYGLAREIPSGQTRTYGQIAAAMARPGAARAVGTALGRNPIPLIIPCHRVLAASGRPGGFSAPGGIHTKARLLAIEGALPPGWPD